MTFGKAARARRLELQMTQELVAESAGVTPNYLGRIEADLVNPSLSVAVALAQALNVELQALVDGRRKYDRVHEDHGELLRAYEAMPAEGQKALRTLLKIYRSRK